MTAPGKTTQRVWVPPECDPTCQDQECPYIHIGYWQEIPTSPTAPDKSTIRNQLVGAIGEAIMDGHEQFPPFPTMPAELAWRVAEEILQRLESLGVVKND